LLLVGAFLIRAGWGLRQPASDEVLRALPDQVEYLALGRNLLHAHALKFHDQRFDADVYAYRAPGYPLLIAACRGNVRAVRLAQAAIDASTVLAAYLLGRRWLTARASFVAALLVAINPFLIYFSGLILSETLFIAMLAWGTLLVTEPVAAGRRSRALPVLGVFLLALSMLVRPSALLLPLLFVIKRPRMILLTVVITIVVLLPWALRNRAVLGHWVWTTTNSGITAYDGLNPAADGSSNQTFVEAMPELKELGEVERSKYLSNLAWSYARENPLHAMELAFRKIARTWSPVPLSRQYGSQKLYVLAGLLYSVPFDILVIAGLWRGPFPWRAKMFLMLPAIYFTLVHAISVGSLRYRLPAEVPMGVVAAAGFELVGRRARQENQQLTTIH
jgi:4-amino-4-deoxy-L-arabinose transferase-like glycosyltransferase